MLPGLRDDLSAVVADPPLWDKRVLEVALRWPDLSEVQGRMAAALRVFLLTWDPFEWAADRPVAFATSTRRTDGFGLVLYVPHWQAVAMAEQDPDGLSGVMGRFGESILGVATEQQAALAAGVYAQAVHEGRLPDLLSRVPAERALPAPMVELVDEVWDELEFAHLEDLAQAAFGPADLDRSPVEFQAVGEHRPDCPGCAGQAVAFPDGIKEAQATICSTHRAEALQITTARLEQAKVSNPGGWEALLAAGRRLGDPHLPNGLGPKLLAAASVDDPTPAQLSDQADLVVATAGLMAGLPHPDTALGGQLVPVRTWLEALPATLVAHGMGEAADAVTVAVAELLQSVRPESVRPESVRPESVRPESVRPESVRPESVRPESVRPESVRPESVRPDGLVDDPARGPATDAPVEEAQDAVPPKPEPFRRGPRIGRNAPCTCGSGMKYKYCCGQG